MFNRDTEETIQHDDVSSTVDYEETEDSLAPFSDFFANAFSSMSSNDIDSLRHSTKNTKRINRNMLAKLLKERMEENTTETLPLRSYKTIILELFHVMGIGILHGNDISMYPIGLLSTRARFGELRCDDEKSIDDWFYVHSHISLSQSFRKKLKLYMLTRQNADDVERYKAALREARISKFDIAEYI